MQLFTKPKIIFLTSVVLTTLGWLVYQNWLYPTQIKLNPESAILTIDGQSLDPNSKLKRGKYEITATSPGYKTALYTLNVPQTSELEITLAKEAKFTYPLKPNSLYNTKYLSGWLIGLERETQNLVRLKDEKYEVVYPAVANWDFSHNHYLITPQNTPNSLIILPFEGKGITQTINSPTKDPIASAALLDDSVLFLSSLNRQSRKYTLYQASSRGTIAIMQTNATSIHSLTDNQALLIAKADHQMSTTCTILGDNLQELAIAKANFCRPTLSGEEVAFIQENAIILYSTTTKQSTPINPPATYFHADILDNSLITIHNNPQGLVISHYNRLTQSFNALQTIPNLHYRQLIGMSEGKIAIVSDTGEIVNIPLEI